VKKKRKKICTKKIYKKIVVEKQKPKVSAKVDKKKVTPEIKYIKRENVEKITPDLKMVSIECKKILAENKINFKKCYFYDGPEVKRIKFYNVKIDNVNSLLEISKSFRCLNSVVGTEVSISDNIYSLFVYTQLAENKTKEKVRYFTPTSTTFDEPKEVKDKKKKEKLKKEKPVTSKENKEESKKDKKEIKEIVLGVAKEKNENELIKFLNEEGYVLDPIIDSFYPDIIIEKILTDEVEYVPFVNKNGRIEWKIKEE